MLTPEDSAQQQTLLNISSSDRETKSLRVTFDIEQLAYTAAFFAEVGSHAEHLRRSMFFQADRPQFKLAPALTFNTPSNVLRARMRGLANPLSSELELVRINLAAPDRESIC